MYRMMKMKNYFSWVVNYDILNLIFDEVSYRN